MAHHAADDMRHSVTSGSRSLELDAEALGDDAPGDHHAGAGVGAAATPHRPSRRAESSARRSRSSARRRARDAADRELALAYGKESDDVMKRLKHAPATSKLGVCLALVMLVALAYGMKTLLDQWDSFAPDPRWTQKVAVVTEAGEPAVASVWDAHVRGLAHRASYVSSSRRACCT